MNWHLKAGSIHEATLAIRSLLVLHFHTCSAPTPRFGLLYRNILFSMLQVLDSKRHTLCVALTVLG